MGVKFNNMRFLDMTCENNGRHQYNDICPSFLKRSPGLETAIIPSDVYLLRSDLHQGIYIPALRHLVFERQQIAAFSVITGLMPHLTSLKINQLTLSTPDSLSYAYIAFTSTPSLLRSLTINFIPREAEEILGQELTIQNLPRLEQLYLHCEECPQSSLFGPLNNNVQSSLFIQQLCRFFRGQNNAAMKAQCAGLKTLDIQSVVRSPNALHNFLLSLPPSLTSLDIGEAKKRHNDDGLSIFDRESFNLLSGQDGQVLPALKRLWISVGVVKLGRDKALVNMLKARCRSGCDVELDLERVQWPLQRKDSLDIQAKFISAEGPGQVVLMW